MRILQARNAHQGLPNALRHLSEVGIPMPSRAGNVLVAPTPVTTILNKPAERVIFWKERDANPFFHFFECLWMVSGRDDAAFLNRFVSDFGKRFSDDGKTLHGAYGFRWRKHFRFDQIPVVIEKLQKNPFDRRVVLQMWDADDLIEPSEAKDLPCNLLVIPRVVYGERDKPNRLNFLVCNRSHDVIWGLFGANAVHFSFLQEYVAANLGLDVGTLTFVSNNFHAYVDVYEKIRQGDLISNIIQPCPYETGAVSPFPLIEDAATWDRDLALFMEEPASVGFLNPFFHKVAKPLWFSHLAFKRKDFETSLDNARRCEASDWTKACVEWLLRRTR